MKFVLNIGWFLVIACLVTACKGNEEKSWNVPVDSSEQNVEILDISKIFYGDQMDLITFKKEFPFFQGNISDMEFAERRRDTTEIEIYKEAIQKIDLKKLKTDFGELFAHIQYYFPEFKSPKVFLYSSALQGVVDPIFYRKDFNMLFVDISAFMGNGNKYYRGLDLYLQNTMNIENLIPKSSYVLAQNFVPYDPQKQKFLDKIVYFGKVMTLQDAFLPKVADNLKLSYTPEQLQWAKTYETNIWDYFVENNLLFSDEQELDERFLSIAPFSKFYTEIDRDSSPQIGIWVGWQICRRYYQKHPKVELADFVKIDATELFNASDYRPK